MPACSASPRAVLTATRGPDMCGGSRVGTPTRRRSQSVVGTPVAGARIAADMVGNLDRQSGCRYRARIVDRLAAAGKQASAYSLAWCGWPGGLRRLRGYQAT